MLNQLNSLLVVLQWGGLRLSARTDKTVKQCQQNCLKKAIWVAAVFCCNPNRSSCSITPCLYVSTPCTQLHALNQQTRHSTHDCATCQLSSSSTLWHALFCSTCRHADDGSMCPVKSEDHRVSELCNMKAHMVIQVSFIHSKRMLDRFSRLSWACTGAINCDNNW